MKNRKYWTGKKITFLNFEKNDVFVYGSNIKGINGAGAAKSAMILGKDYGARNGVAHGFNGEKTYAILTKILDDQIGSKDPKTGFIYNKGGYKSVSPEQIRANIDQLYSTARLSENADKRFLISYQYETWENGTPKKSLNGYDSQEMLEMFVRDDIPENIVFHESYKPQLEKILKNNNMQPTIEDKVQNNTLNNDTNLNALPNLLVISPREKAPEGFTVLNTTSRDKDVGKDFSPFYLGNIELYEGNVAKNMENAWQFTKVYPEFADANGNPSEEYFKWAKKGWNDNFAHRYANGKGNIPLYSYWKTFKDGQWEEHKWDYVTARKNIYFPLYAKAIVKTEAFQNLKSRVESGEQIALWDFDGYNHAERKMTYEDVVNSPKYKCGHAFVLYGLLTKQLKLINDELVYDFDLKIPDQTNKKEYTYFFETTSSFSQWHPSLFKYKQYDFICAEQFMMFSKAKTFGDNAVAEKIINIENCFRQQDGSFKNKADEACYNLVMNFKAGKIDRKQVVSYNNVATWKAVQALIKKLGREVSNYNDDVWNEKRVPVVSIASREKYSQNPDLYTELMNTGETIMVEAAKHDKIWGIGLDEATAKKTDPEKWPGLNLLGGVLTDLKTYFRQQLKSSSKMKM